LSRGPDADATEINQTMNTVRVPGKVMLSGEYAVLDGAAAIMLPVQRFLTATRVPAGPAGGYGPVVAAARDIEIPALAEHEADAGVPHLVFDRSQLVSRQPDGRELKLGLGLSAAEAVGTIALRYECAGLPWLNYWRDVAGLAMDAHRSAQQGLGSGADIAACAYGRPLRYRLKDGGFQVEDLPDSKSNPRVSLNLAWTGQPADTRDQVRRYCAWRDRRGSEAELLCARLREYSDELAQRWFSSELGELIECIDEHATLMDEISAAAGLSYRVPAHARLEAWARRHGGRAKPTGAGGGDMVLLVGELPLQQLGELEIIPITRTAP
jgi:phosphomevalonate kinase